MILYFEMYPSFFVHLIRIEDPARISLEQIGSRLMPSVPDGAVMSFYSWAEKGFLDPGKPVLDSPIADGDRILLVALKST